MFEWLASPEAWVALVTLTALEIVLGIDNIIFISILVGRLPETQRNFARRMGLSLAMLTRLGLLFSISWVMGLTEPWFTILGNSISGRDIVLIGGGLFLLFKATHEIHNSLEGVGESGRKIVVTSHGNGAGTDCGPGYCFFAGFGNNGCRSGGTRHIDGDCHRFGSAGNVNGGQANRRLCRHSPNYQDSCTFVPDTGRRYPDSRRFRCPCP